MIKWFCFHKTRLTSSAVYRFKDYIPYALKHLTLSRDLDLPDDIFMERLGAGVTVTSRRGSLGEPFNASNTLYLAYGAPPHGRVVNFETAREAFEAGEKAFASNYPELYLQAVVNEGGRSSD